MKNRDILLVHLLCWFCVVNQSLFPATVGRGGLFAGGAHPSEVGLSLLLNATVFYLVYYAFPRLVTFRRWSSAAAAALGMAGGLLLGRLGAAWIYWKIAGHPGGGEMAFAGEALWNELRQLLVSAAYALLIRFLADASGAQKRKLELTSQQQADELALLRAQVNPHFLFNTLNSIYSLVYQRSEEAPGAVMKFSSVMRYVLSDATAERVSLDKEVEYLISYIELQSLRVAQPGFVNLALEGDTARTVIAPMLLFPLVENAFKHGSKTMNPGIFVRLECGEGWLRFTVANYLRENRIPGETATRGTGLAHLRRRLELTYPGQHSLQTKTGDNRFTVTLEIGLPGEAERPASRKQGRHEGLTGTGSAEPQERLRDRSRP